MTEASAQDTGNLKQNNPLPPLFSYLDTVLAVASAKFKMEKASNKDRMGWGRLITQVVQAYGDLYYKAELEAVKKEVEEIKTHVETISFSKISPADRSAVLRAEEGLTKSGTQP